jgi:eukaryotic-like serine/threonine-protein kinase
MSSQAPASDILLGAAPYRIVREIGRGGMGTVYLATRDDAAFQKRVAVKVLKRGLDTDAIVRRFRNERQILASLQHPSIASVIDGGTTRDGLPFFVMDYIEGQPIDVYCEVHHLDTRARIELFRHVCAAVHYAHQNLIVHRDLKPANVLVTTDGTVKLLDFGIAKLLNPELAGHTLLPTAMGPQMMTPEYASPEQVRGEAVTTASDVYSLGVLLYELLTGRRPYLLTGRSPSEIAQAVCELTPVRPSTAVTAAAHAVSLETAETRADGEAPPVADVPRSLRDPHDTARLRKQLVGDLDNIILKALSKEPSRRYASADQLSEDLRRHIAGLPVLARPDTIRYRASKFVGRNRALVATATVGALALIAGIIGTAWQASVAHAERARAEQRFNDVRTLASSMLFQVHDTIRDLPGSTPARQLLVSNGLQYLDKLSRDAGERPDLVRELAAAYLRLADVQGRPFTPNLGDTPGALASYQKAVAMYDRLAAAGLSDPALRRETATAYQRLSEVLAATGRTDEAVPLAEKALALQQAVIAEHGETARDAGDLRRELSIAYTRFADLLSATGKTEESLRHRRAALSAIEAAAALNRNHVENLRQLAMAHQKLGNTLGNPNYPNVGDHQGGLAALERAYDVVQGAIAAHPDNAMFKRYAAVFDSNASDVLLALERPDDAMARLRRSLAVLEALATADATNVTAQNDAAISRSKIAGLLLDRGHHAEALREYRRVLDLHLRLAASDPGNVPVVRELASDHHFLARALTSAGDHDEAVRHHDEAVRISRALSARDRADIERQVAVALALNGRGDAYAALAAARPAERRHALVEAERDYAEAVAILEPLQQKGAIESTDVTSLNTLRDLLAKVRAQLNRG